MMRIGRKEDRESARPCIESISFTSNPSLVKLTKNYRSHQAILAFPNAQFYKNELEACARQEITHSIVKRWKGLVKNDYPVIFHGVCGQDMREDPSPSYFNPDEVIVVRDYVRSLLGESLGLGSPSPFRTHSAF